MPRILNQFKWQQLAASDLCFINEINYEYYRNKG